jgi:glyoxylase-like metal-dependent hydrolase (beta-lactamase superfamily II)
MKKLFIVLLVSVLIYSCNSEKKKVIKENPIKLHILSGGKIVVNNLELFSQDTTYHGQSKTFADAFYVIQHPKGNLMWDAGLPEGLVGQKPFTDPSGAFTVSRKDSLANQLKNIGLKVSDFKYFALSHNHFDHIGHANTMKNAIWLVQENEYDFFRSDAVKKNNGDLYNAIKDLTKPKKLNGDYDVFSDGTVIIKYAPGHTIGHQTLYLNIGLEKPVILIGDLYHFEENRENRRVPIFNHDKESTLKSMELIESFAKEKGAEIIIQHSQNDFERLTKMIKN